MPRLQPPPGCITAKEAIKRLNISDATLYQYVKSGQLRRYGPEGRKYKFYSEKEVDALFASRNTSGPPKAKPPIFFGIATPQDLRSIADIDERIFNTTQKEPEDRDEYIHWIEETYHRWMRRNPETFFVARDVTGKVVGYASLVPIKKETLDRFIRDDIAMSDITENDVESFEPGKPLHVYVIALCVDPTYKSQTRTGLASNRGYGARLIKGVFNFLFDLARRGVEIETITARNLKDKPDGLRMLRKIGMPQLRSPVAGKNLFAVDVAESGYPEMIKYSNLLAHWKKTHRVTQEQKG